MEEMRMLLERKADSAQTQKDMNRLDQMVEEMRQNMVNLQDKSNSQGKELERLSQFVDMLSKTINSLRL